MTAVHSPAAGAEERDERTAYEAGIGSLAAWRGAKRRLLSMRTRRMRIATSSRRTRGPQGRGQAKLVTLSAITAGDAATAVEMTLEALLWATRALSSAQIVDGGHEGRSGGWRSPPPHVLAAAAQSDRLRAVIAALPAESRRQFCFVVISRDELARGARVH